ncbi:hypothetical protein C9J12_27965 [Photobacterium frigidiphilum]|uniref:Uncharacterized protein n=1 Tax=Photobacterium frigidiphilum TaxID=264736 RepID=A0A2T3J6H5_9GAMM|nr:hypothetical protein C9J12_27965 [Photobacterium frigidiphilum]
MIFKPQLLIVLTLTIFLATACVETRYADDQEWKEMNVQEKVLNERRNVCAIEGDGTCIIYNND